MRRTEKAEYVAKFHYFIANVNVEDSFTARRLCVSFMHKQLVTSFSKVNFSRFVALSDVCLLWLCCFLCVCLFDAFH